MAYAWYEGSLMPEEDIRVPIRAHSLHYGTSCFEGIRSYATKEGPAVFRLSLHIRRFFGSCAALGMKLRFSEEEMCEAVCDVVRRNGFKECYIRPLAFYDAGMALRPDPESVRVAILAWPWGAYLGDKPLALHVSEFRRFESRTTVSGKIGGYYATSATAAIEAARLGYDEALLLDCAGYVAEGPGENIFFVRHGILIAPDSPSILKGITRESVLEIAGDMGIQITMKPRTTVEELMYDVDEVFLTGTATEIAPVTRINAREIGSGEIGPLTARLRSFYLKVVHGEEPRYKRWLTYVS